MNELWRYTSSLIPQQGIRKGSEGSSKDHISSKVTLIQPDKEVHTYNSRSQYNYIVKKGIEIGMVYNRPTKTRNLFYEATADKDLATDGFRNGAKGASSCSISLFACWCCQRRGLAEASIFVNDADWESSRQSRVPRTSNSKKKDAAAPREA